MNHMVHPSPKGKKICVIFGTRPEAIKLAPVISALRNDARARVRVCVTAQHREMLDQVLSVFEIRPDHDLDVMKKEQSLTYLTAEILRRLEPVLTEEKPDWVVVHGDTTTTMAAALAAFYKNIPVAHVEAGLRTGDLRAPWPEEMNRLLTTDLTALHFAPTERARENLVREGVSPAFIRVTGNTVVDSLLSTTKKLAQDPGLESRIAGQFPFLDPAKKMILVTGHRRENFGEGLENLCKALSVLARRPDVQIVYPIHLNPKVREPVRRLLGQVPFAHLIEPLDYLPFVYLMNRSFFIITDSGGIQEEAPSLGKPVLVTRLVTERPEAVEAGTAKIVGCDPGILLSACEALLGDAAEYQKMARAHNPYGDGRAGLLISEVLLGIGPDLANFAR